MAKVETVEVARKDHPNGFVTINKSDLAKTDTVKGQTAKKPVRKPAKKKAE